MKKITAILVVTLLILLNCLTITAEIPVAISNEDELKAISGKKSYYLANDITLTGDFTPISVFSGNFDGRGKKIINLKITKNAQTTEKVFVGLFEKIDGGKVENLTLENVKISVTGGGNVYVGAVCGRVDSGSVSNCRVSGEISAISASANVYLGGIAGQNKSQINICENLAKINVNASHAIVGGIVGDHARADYILEKCINLGSITVSGAADTNYVGGIVGKTVKTVENCANYGAIKLTAAGNGYVGGIVAALTNGEIKNCYSGGVLTCDAKTDAFVDPIAAEHKNQFSNNFYLDRVISGISTTDIKTASALESKSVSNVSIFSGFDFNNVWKMGENGPVLNCITAAAIETPQQDGNSGSIETYPPLTPDAPAFVAQSVTGKIGDTVTVAVKAVNNPGITGLKLSIGYDSDVLEFVEGKSVDFSGIFSISPVENNPISIVWTDTALITEDGTVALLTFQIKEDASIGSTEITVSYNSNEVFGEDADDKVAFAVENGIVNVCASGDVNNDNKVNVKDLALLLRFVSDWDIEINELAADVNGDGNVDTADLNLLLQYLSDWDVELK